MDSLVLSKLEVFDTNLDDGTFIIMGDNTRTLKKLDSNFDEIWSATLGRKFTISAASEAPDGSVYYAATYTEDAKLFTDEDNITVLHNSGNDVFLGRFIPDEPVMKAQLTSSNSVDLLDDELIFESTVGLREDVSLFPNPFSDALDIRIQPGSYTIELYNMSGELVRRKVLESISEEHIEIPTASLKKGIYSARITKANSKNNVKENHQDLSTTCHVNSKCESEGSGAPKGAPCLPNQLQHMLSDHDELIEIYCSKPPTLLKLLLIAFAPANNMLYETQICIKANGISKESLKTKFRIFHMNPFCQGLFTHTVHNLL